MGNLQAWLMGMSLAITLGNAHADPTLSPAHAFLLGRSAQNRSSQVAETLDERSGLVAALRELNQIQIGLAESLQNSGLPKHIALEKSQPHIRLATWNRLLREYFEGQQSLTAVRHELIQAGLIEANSAGFTPEASTTTQERALMELYQGALSEESRRFDQSNSGTLDPNAKSQAVTLQIGANRRIRTLFEESLNFSKVWREQLAKPAPVRSYDDCVARVRAAGALTH
ncbi:MAG TPA: hypothetical protein VM901_02505 [Bdellovibrionota bacterium]|nr:hypothetical protein [Bdellovibrionota bacterium]